jgi:hypothetical protein
MGNLVQHVPARAHAVKRHVDEDIQLAFGGLPSQQL